MKRKFTTIVPHSAGIRSSTRKFKARRIVMLSASVVAALPLMSEATVHYWQGNSSNVWSTANNWSPVGVPGPNDGAGVNQGTPTIGLSGANVSYISVGDVSGSTGEVIQTAGTVDIGISMGIGDSGGGTGTYFLEGGTLAFNGSSTPGMIIGGGGTPSFDLFYQTGGVVSMGLQDNISIDNAGGYQINTGSLSCSEMTIAAGGKFNEQGGNVTFAGTVALAPTAVSGLVADCEIYSTFQTATLDVGGNGSAGGAATLLVAASGVLNVSALQAYNTTGTSVTLENGGTINAGTIDFSGNPSLFKWTNGTLHLTGEPLDFTTGTDPYNHHPLGATLTMVSGQTLEVDSTTSSWEWLSGDGSSVTQNTGSSNSCNSLYIGSTGMPATYSLKGGTLSSNNQTEYVGYIGTGGVGGTGVFNQSGGTNTTTNLHVADSAPGTYTLSGGSLNTTEIDVHNQGTFHQSGGTMQFSTFKQDGGTVNLDLGLNLVAAKYNLSGGSLTTTAISDAGVQSNLNWTNGSLTLTNQPADLTDGTDPSYNGIVFGNTLTLNTGMALTISNSSWWEYLYGNASSITQNAGSSNTMPALFIGNTSGAGPADSYILNGGTLSVTGTAYIGYTGTYIGGTGAGTVNQSGGTATISTLYIANNKPGSYSLSGTGSLQVSGTEYVGAAGISGSLSMNAGTNTAGTLIISDSGIVGVHGGSLTASTTVNSNSIVQDAGTSSLGALSGTGFVTLGGGGGTTTMTVTQFVQNKITVESLGVFSVQANSHFDNTVSTLSILGSGRVDLANNHMFIQYGAGADPIATIAAQIKLGYANGAWNGNGIMSTNAQTNGASYGIGYADSADPGNPAGLSSGTIEIKYTLLGDANLDGAVNGSDFAIMASNFNKAVGGWDQGDFNYDGAVNGADFADLASNFNKGASQSATAALDTFAQTNGLIADVPEPMSIAAVLITGVASLARRRRLS